MDVKMIRKLLFLLVLDGSISICDTCTNASNGIGLCPYLDGRCDSNLSYYNPNEEYLK